MYYPAEKLAQFPWIVSSGTLRSDHLADAFLGVLDRLGLECPEPFRSDLQQCAAYASDTVGPEPAEAWVQALDWAFGALNDAAPSGFYFGASEGDGACFGFWLEQDWADAIDERGLASGLEQPEHAARFIEAAEDYGLEPGTLCDGYCGSVEGYTASQAGAEYAAQLADDCGMVPDAWPLRHIDWEKAWRELELSDSYGAAPSLRSGEWWIFRSV